MMILWSKNYRPWYLSYFPLYDIILFVVDEIKKENLVTRSKAVAFSLFISIFPSIIFLFTLLPLIPAAQDYSLLLSKQLSDILPANAYNYIFSIIMDIVSIQREGLLSLGFVLALFFSSNGLMTLMKGFDKTYEDTFSKRHWINTRLVAIGLTFVLTLLLIMSMIGLFVEDIAVHELIVYLGYNRWVALLVSLVNFLISFTVIYTGISLIFQYGPSMYRKIKFINTGSFVATFLLIITSKLFAYFINNFGKFNELYGSIGALIVFMLWIQINSLIILIGFELNASIAVHLTQRRLERQSIED